MNIRRGYGALFLALAMVIGLCGTAQARLRVALKLYGGYNYLLGGEANDGAEGYLDIWVRQAEFYGGYSSSGSYKPFHHGITGGGDLIICLTPNIGIGFGAGYLQSSSSSVVNLNSFGSSAMISLDPKVSAIPIRAGLHISIPLGASASLVFQGGAGYYLGKYHDILRVEEGANWIQWEQTADGKGMGFHGGLGFEMNFGPNFGLVLEALGCSAKIGGFEGEVVTSSTGFSVTNEGKLYYFRVTQPFLGSFPVINISETPPSGSDISNVREAKVDFSGVSARAGFVFKF